jgi:hypothetical protein
VTRYWSRALLGLAIAALAIVGVDWGIYHLVRTGSCGSSTTYVSTRPCPPGTGGHILALVGGIFGGLIGIAIWGSRGPRGRPAAMGLGLIMWSLLFVTLAGSVALAAFGPANSDNAGARTAAIVLAVVFLPMGLAPLPLALAGARRQPAQPISLGPPVVSRPPPAANPPDPPDPLDRLAKLGELRRRGLVTEDEFEAQKKRLLDEL